MRLYREVISQAIGSLLAHRFRAALTMLGISWGIVTVVLLMAYGSGFQRAVMYGFRNAFSPGTVLVGSGQTSMQAGGERSGRRILLKQDDVEAIQELGSIKFVSPEYMQSVPIAYGLVGSSRVDLQACKLEYSIVSPK